MDILESAYLMDFAVLLRQQKERSVFVMKAKYFISFLLCIILVLGINTSLLAGVERVSLGVGTPGGVWYMIGAGMSKVINTYVANVNCAPVSPAGIAENPKNVSKGTFTMALVTNDSTYFAMRGQREYKEKYPNIRSMLALSVGVIGSIVFTDSGINSFYDFKGKRLGCPSATSLEQQKAFFKVYGMDARKDIKIKILTYAEQITAIKDGHIDIAWMGSFPRNARLDEIRMKKPIKFISMESDKRAEFDKSNPYWKTSMIPAGTYAWQKEDCWGPSWYGSLSANKDVDEKLIYNITKAIFEHHDELAEIHPGLKKVTFEQTKKFLERGLFIAPFHPGAAKYIQERGVKIPAKFLVE
jgi:TRAP transporter TAXI family solute receptor